MAYLRDDIRQVDLDAVIGDPCRRSRGWRRSSTFSKAEALERAIRDLPEIAEVSTDLEVNPFPASLEVRFLPEGRTTEDGGDRGRRPRNGSLRGGRSLRQEWVERLFFLQEDRWQSPP